MQETDLRHLWKQAAETYVSSVETVNREIRHFCGERKQRKQTNVTSVETRNRDLGDFC